jgi:hypothetical protein
MNSAMKRFAFLWFMLAAVNAFSQVTGCVDPNRIVDRFYYCSDPYNPVCGCDGNTYRNDCSAKLQYALTYTTPGPCTNFDYDISPNQVFDILNVKLVKTKPGYFTVNIFDSYGHQFFTQTYPYSEFSFGVKEFSIGVATYLQGIYIIEVVSEGEQQLKKFLKVNYN